MASDSDSLNASSSTNLTPITSSSEGGLHTGSGGQRVNTIRQTMASSVPVFPITVTYKAQSRAYPVSYTHLTLPTSV